MSKRRTGKNAKSRKNDVDIRAVNTVKVRGVTFGVFVVDDRLAYTGRMNDNGRAFKAAIPTAWAAMSVLPPPVGTLRQT